MNLGPRIFLAYLVLFALCLAYPLNWMANTLDTRYREGVEDPLVDQAHLLAELVAAQLKQHCFTPEQWQKTFQALHTRRFQAQIYSLTKDRVDSYLYITDQYGKVVFHSQDPAQIGQDFSGWRDVALTLQGKYGSRTTRKNPEDEASSVLHVAAPLYVEGRLAGVLTVAKPTTNIRYFHSLARYRILWVGLLSLTAAGLLSFAMALWITRPIKRLTAYAQAISAGKTPALPVLDSSEIGTMGRAFVHMQETLEGKRYVEEYVEHLTHELKSPLSAIRGAAELLAEPMAKSQQTRFLNNICSQAGRIQEIVDRMLELAALEHGRYQFIPTPLYLSSLVQTVLEEKAPIYQRKELHILVRCPTELKGRGEAFLLHQALGNVVQNAIDFSPPGGEIFLNIQRDGAMLHFEVVDEGAGIPAYALPKLFDKFFSLQRPITQQKSTGLGLSFVQQVAKMHQGQVKVENRAEGGVRAVLSIRA